MWALKILIYLFYLQSSIAELRLLQTLFRHGNRTPVNGSSYYLNDPYLKNTYEPDGFGALTIAGKQLAYSLGEFYRERYSDFLGPIYSKNIIQFYSSAVDRVVMTGQLVAAGLYPPTETQRWNSELNWQPIPVWPLPSENNMYATVFCKNYKKWKSDIQETDADVVQYIKDHEDDYKYLSENVGSNITQSSVLKLRQLLFTQKDVGLELPEWTKSVFPNGKLDELAAYDLSIPSRSIDLKQLSGGIWIKEFLKNIDNYLNKTNSIKAYMYAGHELNIAFFLGALDNFDNVVPYYCSTIMFELHEKDNKYYVQIFYKNEDNITTLKIPGCGDKMCPLNTFRKFVEPVLPKDFVKLCGTSTI